MYRGVDELPASQENKAGPPPVLETAGQYIQITHQRVETTLLVFCPVKYRHQSFSFVHDVLLLSSLTQF